MKTKSKIKSLRGKWGKVGAPLKSVSWPKSSFTMATLFQRNSLQCELTLRNKVDDAVAEGRLLMLKSKKQPGGKVGRPMRVFVLKENFVPDKHELAEPLKKFFGDGAAISTTSVDVGNIVPAAPPTVVVPVDANPQTVNA